MNAVNRAVKTADYVLMTYFATVVVLTRDIRQSIRMLLFAYLRLNALKQEQDHNGSQSSLHATSTSN
jgi:hypothetical protein